MHNTGHRENGKRNGQGQRGPLGMTVLLGCLALGVLADEGAEKRADLDSAPLPAAEQHVRQQAFDHRNDPQELARLSREFLSLTFLSEWGNRDFNRPGRWEQLKAVRALMDAGDYPAALERFKNSSLEKLRYLDDLGLSIARFDPFSGGPAMWKWIHPLIPVNQQDRIMKQADDLMVNIITVKGKRLHIGTPGTINWKAASDEQTMKESGAWSWTVETFNPLLAAYLISGKRSYLAKWEAFADDWAMNQRYGVGALNAADIPDAWAGGAENTLTLMRYFRGIAMQSQGPELLSAATYARVMDRMIRDFVPLTMMYHRSNPQNWTDASVPTLFDIGWLLDEYRFAPELLREGRRRLELITPTRHFPDGADNDSTVGYGFLYMLGCGPVLERLIFRSLRIPDWMLPAWEKRDWLETFDLFTWQRDIREEMQKRSRFMIGHTMANGEWPIGGTRNTRSNRALETANNVMFYTPELFQNPDMARILAIGKGNCTEWPSFTSERFPVSGHTYMRAGWNRSDPYLFMYCASRPTVGALSWRNNNAIGIGGFGQDLIETGENGTYDQPHTPVRVDGQDQYFHAGIQSWGHRGPMLMAWQDPAPWRWSDSAFFDVAEGVYAGNFGKPKGITDVSHQRLVHYVRGGGLWIITDRLRSPTAHTYTLDWWFGIPPSKHTDFLPEQIKVDKGTATIKTQRPELANISLHHFPSVPLTFETSEARSDPKNGYRIHDFLKVSGSWKAPSESVVITAILPRETVGEELLEVKPLDAAGVKGFAAKTPKGDIRVLYQAAITAPARLSLDDVTSEGESLLVTLQPDGTCRGVALGCRTLGYKGQGAALTHPDVEFTVHAGQLVMSPIYTPIKPVKIEPSGRNVFADCETISISCDTPDVEIRYTTDGSEPGLTASLYQRPFVITNTVIVKARAMRKGLRSLPVTMSGTWVSLSSRADFSKGVYKNAVPVANTVAGLTFAYYEGRWQDLMMALDTLKPIKSGIGKGLFDIRSKGDASVFAFQYSGYLEVPEDGVYTFTAPKELYLPNVFSGFELDVTVDGNRWYPATQLHALGTWSVALRKGKHLLLVTYKDMRADAVQKLNVPGVAAFAWAGMTPEILLEGPGLAKGPIAERLLSYAK